MTTVQVDEDVKRELFTVAAELQSKLGRRVSLSEAIKFLLQLYRARNRDVDKILSLFGCLGPSVDARRALKELRTMEEKSLERLTRKYNS